MQNLNSIVYVSSATWLLSEDELAKILSDAQETNSKNQITGVLLYNDGTFFQYIEGPAEKLAETYEKIKGSRQHRGIIELLTEEIDQRRFPDWYMGFFHPTKDELLQLSDQAWWGSASQVMTQGTHAGIQMLELFCRNNQRV